MQARLYIEPPYWGVTRLALILASTTEMTYPNVGDRLTTQSLAILHQQFPTSENRRSCVRPLCLDSSALTVFVSLALGLIGQGVSSPLVRPR